MPGNYVLIVDDVQSLAMTYEQWLISAGYRVKIASNGTDALQHVNQAPPLAVLLDLNLPDIDGLEVLKQINDKDIHSAVIVITGQTSLNTAVEAMKYGADDFLSKPIDPERLKVSLSNAIEKNHMKHLISTLEDTSRMNFQGFIGGCPEMQAVYRMVESAAKSHAPVMITGESGTGKEITAQSIHNLSPRADREMVALNCAAIPHDLIESEIFGHVKGAFTGATSNREGAAERANGGTLFLDELTEMPLPLQSKLLRFVQTGIYTPVGSNKQIQSNIRFICATNRDPMEAIDQNRLREDLYYRLAVIPVHLPPLRDRGNDIILLAEHFLKNASRKEGKRFMGFDKDAAEALLAYKWPGNVRELENIIRNCVIMNDGKSITRSMVSAIEYQKAVTKSPSSFNLSNPFTSASDILPWNQIEQLLITSAINACNGNITQAAKKLELNPSTLHRKQKEWSRQ